LGSEPQSLPAPQVVTGVQPHLFGVPPPPQVTPVPVHVPHDESPRDAPQLSVPTTLPQSLPSREQNVASSSGVQPQTLADSAPHVCGKLHVPHDATVRVAPQLSLAVTSPQLRWSRVQNAGSNSPVQPHTLVLPQTVGSAHVPHVSVRDTPQLSSAVTVPQFFPSP
jgi:hypothetical protein